MITLEELLAAGQVDAVKDLYDWGLNYDTNQNPFNVFLDLIGYSEEQFGEKLAPNATLDYTAADYVGDALKQYAIRPNQVELFIELQIESEIAE